MVVIDTDVAVDLLRGVRPAEVWWASLDPFDVLIARTAIVLGETLQTFNAKHFKAVAGLRIARPYVR